MIKQYKASHFEGICNVDEDFFADLDQMNYIAQKHNMIVVVTSSFRLDAKVKGAIVPPSKRSNHLIGQAIDCNVKNKKTGEYYNSTKMGDGKGADELFLRDVDENTNLRWGVAFNNPDSVHFDSGLNLKNPKKWQEKYNEFNKK